MVYYKISIVLVALTLGSISSDKAKDYEDHPYEFGFTINGQQHRKESKDINGIIRGEFGFITADGVYHVTVYATDEHGLFHIISTKNIRLGDAPGQTKTNDNSKSLLPPQPPRRQIVTTLPPTLPPTTLPPTTQPPTTTTTTQRTYTLPPYLRTACSSCTIPLKSPIAQKSAVIQPQAPAFQPQQPSIVPQPPISPPQSQNPSKISLNEDNDIQTIPFTENYKLIHQVIHHADVEQQTSDKTAPCNDQATQQPNVPLNQQAQPFDFGSKDTFQSHRDDEGIRQAKKVNVDHENGVITVPGNDHIKLEDKYPNMQPGLPDGITKSDISDILYKFNYTVGFHGHYEKGLKDGSKIGGYFINGRDGLSQIVTYVADKNGYHPKVKFVRLGLDSPDTPKEETEKTFGLKNFEFVWYPVN